VLSKRSIRNRFLVQLIIASVALIMMFSSILYLYIQNSIIEDKKNELLLLAKQVSKNQSLALDDQNSADVLLRLTVELLPPRPNAPVIGFSEQKIGDDNLLILIHPFGGKEEHYLKITKNITSTKTLLAKILNSIFIINAIGFILIILYALALSQMLVIPIRTLSRKLSNMNESMMKPINIDELPEEFEPLGETINRLIGRIQTFVKYQKELFIGAAHELKTPLAVIKLKNQVTLIKKRSAEEYIDAIKTTNNSVNEMDKIVGDILNVGRQEGAQLEPPERVNVQEILMRKGEDFLLLAQSEGKQLEIDLQPDIFVATIQVNLLNQIIQNFLQNALKFTASGKKVILRSAPFEGDLLIEVIDEGIGIDESIDLFAPFKREGNKSGAGLGLFLAKSAAEALRAEISLLNRSDGTEGTVASLRLNSSLCCALPLQP
jgi:two-component system OmpR family sensor kinase